MLSIVRGAPMHQYDESPRQNPAFEELPYKFAVPARSSPSSPVRDTLFENVTPHKNLMANLRRELEPVHYEFDQFSKDLEDTLDKLGDLQVMAEENEEEMDELGKQWVRVSQGINHLRESLASTQWFLENTFHDYGWNQYEQCNGEEDEGQETSAYRERHSISSTERHEITSEASAMQALKKLQLEMVQIMQGYATLHRELDILESRQKQSEYVMQHTLLDVDEYHLMLEDAQQTLWMMGPEISSRREGTMMTMESMFEFDKRQQEVDDDVASEWGRSSVMSGYSAAEEEEADRYNELREFCGDDGRARGRAVDENENAKGVGEGEI